MDELRRREELRVAKKRRRELDRLERSAARKMASAAARNTASHGCVPEQTSQVVDVVGPSELSSSDIRTNSVSLDICERGRQESSIIKHFEEDIVHNPGLNTDHVTSPANRKSPLIDTTSVSRPSPEVKACPFSIDSLLDRRQRVPPGGQTTNHARHRTCERTADLQFQPIGFQVERLSPSSIHESTSIRNSSPTD